MALVLLLFDIDGTLLLRASAEHAQALRDALECVFGVQTSERVDAAGRTDTAIARDLAALCGVDDARFDAGLDELIAYSAERYALHCPTSLEERVAPGMAELLDALAVQGDARLSLVSGNYEPVARLKLERAGLGHHFEAGQGAFGSDDEDRLALPAIARRRAGGYPRAGTIVIGDTPRDIACARADGVRVLAVATGLYTVEELAGADAVVTDGFGLAELLGCEPIPDYRTSRL
jgi:phosphoglycolate phosphatase-like HAD superfamily hydrolase